MEKRESIYTDRFVHSLHKKEWRCSCPARIGEFNNWKGKSYKEFKLLSTRSESHRDSSRDSYRDSYRDTRESEEEEEPVAMVKAVQRKFPSRAYSSGQQPVVRRISDSESKTNPDHSKIRKNTDKKLSKPDFMEGSSSNIRKKIISKSSLPPPQTDKEVSSPHSSPVIERPHSQENLLPTGLTNNLPPPTHSWHYSNTQKTHVRSREDRKSVPSFFSKMDGQELLTSSAEEEMEKIRTEPSSEEDSGPEPILDLNNAQKDEEDDGLDPIVRLAIKEFNKNWKDGIKFMKEKGLVTEELSTIAHFLMLYNEKLSKEQLGETLGGKTYKELLIQYTDLFDFTGMKFDAALRKYLSTFMLLGEAQVIDRIMEVFASKYVKDHPGGSFPTKDAAYTMAFSLIMLNTDRHNPAIAENKKMTLPQFLKNNSGLWDGKDPPRELLEELYHAIVNDEIVIRKKGDPDKRGWVKSIKANTYEQGKRWLILINHELRWYKTPNSGDTSGLLGKIPLDYVRIFSDLSKTSFSVASVLPKPVDFFLVNEKGKAVRQEAVEFAVVCENEQQMNLWLKEVRNNVTFNVEPKLDKPLNKFKVNKFRKNQEL
uniref:SEC7 domain-containing protein n=1 Tax=Arcella intermedia TaxID=1963864 RepID=A0A6B2L069_9EUKA